MSSKAQGLQIFCCFFLLFFLYVSLFVDVEHLLSELAQTGARARWRSMGCPDVAAAVGCLAWMLRRRWGMAALRENACLKLERLAYVGRGAILPYMQQRDANAVSWSMQHAHGSCRRGSITACAAGEMAGGVEAGTATTCKLARQ